MREATWSEVDLDAGLWAIPAGRMEMRKAHRVPLAPRALAILQEARALGGTDAPQATDLVFPGTKAGKPLSE